MKCFDKIDKLIDQYAKYCRDNNIDFEGIVEKASERFKGELKQTTLSDKDIESIIDAEIDLLRSRTLRLKLEKAYRLTKNRVYELETEQYLEEFEEKSKETKIRIGAKECEGLDEPEPFSIKSFPEQLDFGKK